MESRIRLYFDAAIRFMLFCAGVVMIVVGVRIMPDYESAGVAVIIIGSVLASLGITTLIAYHSRRF